MNQKFRFVSIAAISTLGINSAMALPIDFSGTFGVDAHSISNLRRSKDDVVKYTPNTTTRDPNGANGKEGTQGINNGKEGASFQTYVFKLNPQIIVNDGVTLKGEISSGYIRGGFAGGEAGNNADGSSNNAYFFTSPAQRSGLNLNQMYMELYADTALVKIGRFAKGYGTGMIWSSGTKAWDRFFTMYDGIEAEMKIGNFSIIPHFAKISSYRNNPTSGSGASGENDVRELGIIAKYDNKNRDLVASVLYAKRSAEPKNALYNQGTASNTAGTIRGKSEVTVIEPYVSKKWNKFKVAAEASIQSGDYGTYDSTIGPSKLSANAYVVEATYELNPKWDLGLHAGQVSGDKGSTGKFEASYLNPNYHIAELMFRYNYAAFTEPTGRSIFDSSITNTRFAKLYGNYKTDKWTWKAAAIMAKAMETSSGSGRSYHHEEGYAFTSGAKQSDDMGYEIDLGFDYRWNPNVVISGFYGFWFVGDYYAFTNDTKELSLTNVHGGGLSATVEF